MRGTRRKFWVGVDPGGTENFGLAILDEEGQFPLVRTVSSALQAYQEMEEFAANSDCTIDFAGAGIDAPLWWSSLEAGRRDVDTWIRERYKLSSGTVQTPNSL